MEALNAMVVSLSKFGREQNLLVRAQEGCSRFLQKRKKTNTSFSIRHEKRGRLKADEWREG